VFRPLPSHRFQYLKCDSKGGRPAVNCFCPTSRPSADSSIQLHPATAPHSLLSRLSSARHLSSTLTCDICGSNGLLLCVSWHWAYIGREVTNCPLDYFATSLCNSLSCNKLLHRCIGRPTGLKAYITFVNKPSQYT
jgi:hypothetical protein